MNGINGFHQRTVANLFFALGDGLLCLGAFFLGAMIRFDLGIDVIWNIPHWPAQTVLFVVVIQTLFYYLDLYEPRNIRQGIKMVTRLVKGLLISFILLAIISYSLPSLALGRGILASSLAVVLPLALLWRFFYAWLIRGKIFKERILIVGSGVLAGKIFDELSENWRDAFEIVGFVDERGEKIGESI